MCDHWGYGAGCVPQKSGTDAINACGLFYIELTKDLGDLKNCFVVVHGPDNSVLFGGTSLLGEWRGEPAPERGSII